MPMKFMVNDEIVELCPASDDEEMCNNLRDNNAFTTNMIRELAESNQIRIQQPILRITRLITETEDELVYIAEDTVEPRECVPDDDSEDCAPTNQTCKDNVGWDDAQTRFILDQCHAYMTQIGPMKKFKTKKVMWHQIAKDLRAKLGIEKTSLQIENRYKTIIRRKKTAVDNNSKSGSSRQEVQYEAELCKITTLDDSIEPECIRSAKVVKRLKERIIQSDSDQENEENNNIITQKTAKKRKISSVIGTLERLQKEKETAKQQRHKEKLDLIRELFGKKA